MSIAVFTCWECRSRTTSEWRRCPCPGSTRRRRRRGVLAPPRCRRSAGGARCRLTAGKGAARWGAARRGAHDHRGAGPDAAGGHLCRAARRLRRAGARAAGGRARSGRRGAGSDRGGGGGLVLGLAIRAGADGDGGPARIRPCRRLPGLRPCRCKVPTDPAARRLCHLQPGTARTGGGVLHRADGTGDLPRADGTGLRTGRPSGRLRPRRWQ